MKVGRRGATRIECRGRGGVCCVGMGGRGVAHREAAVRAPVGGETADDKRRAGAGNCAHTSHLADRRARPRRPPAIYRQNLPRPPARRRRPADAAARRTPPPALLPRRTRGPRPPAELTSGAAGRALTTHLINVNPHFAGGSELSRAHLAVPTRPPPPPPASPPQRPPPPPPRARLATQGWPS